MASDFDYSAVIATLPPRAQKSVRVFCRQLGVSEDSWHRIPAVRRFVVTWAVLELADLEGASNAGDEISDACRALGLEDDPTRATRPSDSIYRRIRRWRARGHGVQPEESDAA